MNQTETDEPGRCPELYTENGSDARRCIHNVDHEGPHRVASFPEPSEGPEAHPPLDTPIELKAFDYGAPMSETIPQMCKQIQTALAKDTIVVIDSAVGPIAVPPQVTEADLQAMVTDVLEASKVASFRESTKALKQKCSDRGNLLAKIANLVRRDQQWSGADVCENLAALLDEAGIERPGVQL